MEAIVKLVLPLITWTPQKVFGPFFKPSEWQAVALSLVPPPENLVNTIKREGADLDSPALRRASVRRRIRNGYKRDARRQLRGNPLVLAACQYLLKWRQELEAEGYTADPARIRKLRDIEAETNDYYASGHAQDDLLKILELGDKELTLESVDQERLDDATSLTWEFATYGEGGTKPTLRLNSDLWQALGIDPENLDAMTPEQGLLYCLSQFEALIGLNGEPPKQANLRRLLKWIIRTHLPPKKEPSTTPKAMGKAIKAGLVHKSIVTTDKETGEDEVDVEDPNAADFVSVVEAGGEEEGRETIIEALARRGIGYSDLTPKEWAEIFEKYDLFGKGYELSSKTGVSISNFFGAAANAKEKKWSHIKKKIRKLSK